MEKPHKTPEADLPGTLALEGLGCLVALVLACYGVSRTGDVVPLVAASLVTFAWAMFRVP